MSRKTAVILFATALAALLAEPFLARTFPAGAGLSGSGLARAEDRTIVNGINPHFPPFSFLGAGGRATGFDIEAVDWIAAKMGFAVKHQPMDLDAIVGALASGKIDLIASGMTASAERARSLDFTKPYYTVTQVLVAAKEDTRDLTLLLASGGRIGAQRGTVTATLLRELSRKPGYAFVPVLYDSSARSLEDVTSRRLDAAAMDSTIAGEMAGADFRVAGDLGAPPEVYGYAVRKGNRELLDKLNKGLELLMASPRWEELKRKYRLK